MMGSIPAAFATLLAGFMLACLSAQVVHAYLRVMHSNPRVRFSVATYEGAIGIHLALMATVLVGVAHWDPPAELNLMGLAAPLENLLWGNVAAAIACVGFALLPIDDSGEPDSLNWMPPIEAILAFALTPLAFSILGELSPAALAADALYFAVRQIVLLAFDRRNLRKIVSPLSIADAMRQLPEGLLYADASGKTIVANDAMRKSLASLGISADASDIREIWEALKERERTSHVPDSARARWNDANWVVLHVGQNATVLFAFEGMGFDEKRRYPAARPLETRSPIAEAASSTLGSAPYSRVIAYDITREAQAIDDIDRANIELAKTQQELLESVEAARQAAENEALLRMRGRVHDVIGQRLSMLHRTIEDDDVSDATLAQLKPLLGGILDDLAADAYINANDEISATVQAYATIGVSVEVFGTLPADESLAQLSADAIREAATNAVKHAGAKNVRARLHPQGFEVTNDGAPATRPIVEGTGLSNIRRAVEAAGGTLEIEPDPFALRASF